MITSPRRWLVHRGNRAFTWLWWSQTISLFGSQVTILAIPALAVFALDAPLFEYALLTVVETLPYLAFSIPAGELADRFDRRGLLIASNLVRAVLLVAITVAAVLGVLSMPILYFVAFAVGIASVVFDVAYQSYVPDLLEPDELLAGNQRMEISESAARTVGPTVAGALIAVLGGAVAVVVDAISYILGAAALLGATSPRRSVPERTPPETQPVSAEPMPGGSIEQMVDFAAALERRVAQLERDADPARAKRPRLGGGAWAGFRVVLGDRALRDMAISTAIFNLGSAAIIAVFLPYALKTVGMGIGEFGFLMGASNVGFVIGAVVVGAVTARLGVGPTLVASAVLGAVATVLLPLGSGPVAVGFLFAGRFIGAFAIPLFNVNARALRQSRAPREAQGRVIAVFRMIDFGTLPLGGLMAAGLVHLYGAQTTLVVSAVLGVISAAWLVWSPMWSVLRLETPADSDRGGAAPGPPAAAGPVHVDRRLVGPAGSVAWPLTITGRIPSIRWAWLAIGGMGLQLTLMVPAISGFLASSAPLVYIGSSVLVLGCVLRNLKVPGFAFIALGGVSNLVAIVANGGYMPVSPDAARAVGHTITRGYTNTVELVRPALEALTDIIVVPPPLPLANVYSIGDLLIVIGLSIALVSAIHGRATPPVRPPVANASTPRLGTSAS